MAIDKNKKLFFISLIPLTTLYLFGLFFFNMYEPVAAPNEEINTNESQTSFINSEEVSKVLAVCDGDTIVVKPSTITSNDSFRENELCSRKKSLPEGFEKVRLLGIDAFESKQNGLGKKGKEYLSNLVLNKYIKVELDKEERDKYGRLLAYIYLVSNQENIIPGYKDNTIPDEDLFINEDLIKNGYAIVYNYNDDIKHINKLKTAQDFARKEMLGAWENSDTIEETPYEYRKSHKRY